MKNRWTTVVPLAVLLAGAALFWAGPAAAGESGEGVLVLGRISDDPQHHHGQLGPLLDYVVSRMADVGIREGRILMARDVQQMQGYLRRGRVDWVTETAAMAVKLSQRGDARPLLLAERSGVALYRTVFFVRHDSPLTTLGDLRGHSLALQRFASTSAYYVPAMALMDIGLEMEPLLSPRDRPDASHVGFLFAGSEANIAAWVRVGLVDAGAFSEIDWQRLGGAGLGEEPGLRIIHRTAPFPRGVELVRSTLSAAVATRLREVLLGAAADPEAGPALRQFFDTTGFRDIDGEAARFLQVLQRGVARVREELE